MVDCFCGVFAVIFPVHAKDKRSSWGEASRESLRTAGRVTRPCRESARKSLIPKRRAPSKAPFRCQLSTVTYFSMLIPSRKPLTKFTHKLSELGLTLVAGVLMGLTFAPVEAWYLAWIALAPLWYLVCRQRNSDPIVSGLGWGIGCYEIGRASCRERV